MVVGLLSMQGQKALGFHQKDLNLCSDDERRSYDMRVIKAAVRKFCLFVAISVWKPGIAVTCRIIFIAWVLLRHGSSADESSVLRWMCSCQSPVWIKHLVITDSRLRLGIYDPNKNFHHIFSSEQVSNTSATFVLTNWGKKYYNKSRYQWWFNLKIG